MTKRIFSIDHNNVAVVREHIASEFATKSWWPTEGPSQAEEEFERMQHRPDTLADWCAKWLDGSQWRQLQKAVNRQLSAPSTQSG
jgi:hypothetical protein